jgi:hypothetical protein
MEEEGRLTPEGVVLGRVHASVQKRSEVRAFQRK